MAKKSVMTVFLCQYSDFIVIRRCWREKTSDVEKTMSDVVFPMSYVIQIISDIILTTYNWL